MENLSRAEAKNLCGEFIAKKHSDQDISQILVELAAKGETADEIAGFSDSLLQHAEPFPNRKAAMDVCGTGGSSVERFNVSTATAFILASLGVNIAKHGNCGSTRPNGSFDLLEELGIPIDLDGSALSACLEETGLAFIYARKFHPAMKEVAAARKLAGRRSIFNLAGPLSNPANITKQVIGTVDEKLMQILRDTAKAIGREACLVVTGFPGIDELSVAGPSKILHDHRIQQEVRPEELGAETCDYNQIPCGNAPENAREFLKLIDGSGQKNLEDIVCVNTGLALYCEGKVDEIKRGTEEARNAIRGGTVKNKFLEYKKMAEKFSRR
jgi:anthranilate phosphoribosyltransferase